ncbi:sulfate/thiosulfate ABC transporter permease CysW, partial [Paenibacillus chibensis]|nr:sulfate/thiosulfate ABC transporter permease CysW [Paenibacillus chibensis]
MAASIPGAAAVRPVHSRPAAAEAPWVKWLLIGAAALVLLWLIVLPLAVVLTQALKKGWDVYLSALSDPDALSALKLTLLV